MVRRSLVVSQLPMAGAMAGACRWASGSGARVLVTPVVRWMVTAWGRVVVCVCVCVCGCACGWCG